MAAKCTKVKCQMCPQLIDLTNPINFFHHIRVFHSFSSNFSVQCKYRNCNQTYLTSLECKFGMHGRCCCNLESNKCNWCWMGSSRIIETQATVLFAIWGTAVCFWRHSSTSWQEITASKGNLKKKIEFHFQIGFPRIFKNGTTLLVRCR